MSGQPITIQAFPNTADGFWFYYWKISRQGLTEHIHEPTYSFTVARDYEIRAVFPCSCDIIKDGIVNVYDVIYFTNHYSCSPLDEPHCDFNDDGAINLFDAIILTNAFGSSG